MSNFNKDGEWDTKTIFEWSTDVFDDTGSDRTKARPISEIVQTGLRVGEPWARIWHNDAFFNHGNYLLWLAGDPVVEKDDAGAVYQVENREPVGTMKYINQSLRTAGTDPNGGNFAAFTVTDAATYWGGTWITDGGSPVAIFTKIGMDTHPDLV